MNQHLKQLVELTAIDRELDGFAPREEALRAEVIALEAKKKEIEVAMESLGFEIKDLHLTKVKNDNYLKELAEKLKELEKKQTQIKSEKELKALQIEEDLVREQLGYANEEIARLDKVEENKREQHTEMKAQIDEIAGQIAEAEGKVAVALAEIESLKKDVYERKNTLSMSMSQTILVFYQKIRRWAGNTAVVPVRKQACMGCHMLVSDKVYGDVLKAEEITTCPSCGRILYAEREGE